MKNTSKNILLVAGIASLLTLPQAHAQTLITGWNFDNLSTGTNLTPSASGGATANEAASSAMSIGLTSPGTTPGADPTAGATGPDASNVYNLVGTDTATGANNTSSSNNTWRLVGTNGWNSGTAIGTQGAQFDVSTVGFSNISFSFDIDVSSQSEANLQVEYSTNGGSTWLNAPLTYSGTSAGTGTILTNSSNANIVKGTYFNANNNGKGNDDWYNDLSVNLSGVSAANEDAGFEVRIVNAATGSADVNASQQVALNNTSGNWRLDNVQVDGTADVPEPFTWALLLGGALVLVIAAGRRLRFTL
jgi:hypothetical protein